MVMLIEQRGLAKFISEGFTQIIIDGLFLFFYIFQDKEFLISLFLYSKQNVKCTKK